MQSRALQYAIFFVVFSALVTALHAYLWQRLVRAPDLGSAFTRLGTRAIIGLGILLPLGMIASRFLPRPAGPAFAWVSYFWFGFAVVLFFLLLGSEVIRGAVHAASAFSGGMTPERRQFLSRAIAAGVAALGVIVGGAGVASALGPVEVTRTDVRIRRFPTKLRGLKIAQISDLHIGPTIGKTWLEDVVRRVNKENPDIVAITGDLVDGSVEELREHVAPLANLRAKHGVYFVTGNHEYYSGAAAWMAHLETLGVRVLRNERVTIGEGDDAFDLAGVEDYSARRFPGHGADMNAIVEGRNPERPLVLLAHQPKHVLEASKYGVDLQLSGHTHGGQIFPWGYAVKIDQPYVAGLDQHGDTQIYTSRGTGYWGPPMRVGAPAEIAVLTLSGT